MSTKILRLPEVLNRVGLKRSALYELIEVGGFPRQVKLGMRSVGWLESSVDAWIKARVEASPGSRLFHSKTQV